MNDADKIYKNIIKIINDSVYNFFCEFGRRTRAEMIEEKM